MFAHVGSKLGNHEQVNPQDLPKAQTQMDSRACTDNDCINRGSAHPEVTELPDPLL